MILTVDMNNEYNHLVNKFVTFLCKELCILPRDITITSYDLAEHRGMCFDEDTGKFTILIKENGRNIGEVFTTIAHEMIHVKQYMKEDLGKLLDENNSLPYEKRWWEKEAFENAVPLVEKFSKTL